MLTMVKKLNSNMINLTINPSLEHCFYSEYDDILVPLKEFYSFGFGKGRVLDGRFTDRYSVMYNQSILVASHISSP